MMMKMKIMEIILLQQQQPTCDAVILLLHLFIHLLLLLPHIKLKSCKNNILFLSAFISI